MSAKPSPAVLEKALKRSKEVAEVESSKPPWKEYVSEGVVSHIPDPGSDGYVDAPVQGHANVVRVWEMNREYYLKRAQASERHYADKARVTIQTKDGKKEVLESLAPSAERKHWKPGKSIFLTLGPLEGWQWRCEEGHTFGFKRGPRPTERGCPYCEGVALAEPA